MEMRQRGSPAPDVHHFAPIDQIFIAVADDARAICLYASEEATSGSVMAKQERISPARSGLSHFSFCSACRIERGPPCCRIGSRAIEDLGAMSSAHDLAERSVFEVGETGAKIALREEEMPEASGSSLWLQLFDDRNGAAS
jgi:hypothetical protein